MVKNQSIESLKEQKKVRKSVKVSFKNKNV